MRIVLDAMGSDVAPVPDVQAAILATQETSHTIILVGDETRIRQELDQHKLVRNIEVVNATQIITMDDKPSVVGRNKPDSSMHVGMRLVKSGDADAFVTAGNTGAAQAVAMLYTLRRIRGVKRPALSAIFPINGKPVTFLDIGANADSKPEWLVQFALMGEIYARKALGVNLPRIALLSNGEEEGKGNAAVTQTGEYLKDLPLNYIGNIEPRDMLAGGVDVIVTDGFIGNILLKTFEATSRYLTNMIREEIRRDVISSVGGILARNAFDRVRKRADTSEVGGAPLLGVDGIVIIAHGGSSAYALKNAIKQAAMAVDGDIVRSIHDGLAELALLVE